jgi:transposase
MGQHRHELSDAEWARLVPLLPLRQTGGRPYQDHRRVLNGMLWILHTGAPWRDLPERYRPWRTVYSRFRRWLRAPRIRAVIPTRRDQRPLRTFDHAAYRQRAVIEQRVGWLKELRRIATRFEKLAVHFLGVLYLAVLQLYLRVGLAKTA